MARKIVVNDTTYSYVIGREFAKIEGPFGKAAVALSDIKGLDGELIVRGRWKQTSDGMVTPSEVAAYIASHQTTEA